MQAKTLREVIRAHHQWRLDHDHDIYEAYKASELCRLSTEALEPPKGEEYPAGSLLRPKEHPGQLWEVMGVENVASTERLLRLKSSNNLESFSGSRFVVLDTVELAEHYDLVVQQPAPSQEPTTGSATRLQLLTLLNQASTIISQQLLPNAAHCFGVDFGAVNDFLVASSRARMVDDSAAIQEFDKQLAIYHAIVWASAEERDCDYTKTGENEAKRLKQLFISR